MELMSTLRIKMVSYILLLSQYLSIYLYAFLSVYINPICLYIGKTSLIETTMRSRTEIVKILLEHGADVNTKDKDGKLHTIIVTIFIYPSVYTQILLLYYKDIHPSVYLFTFISVYIGI